METTVTFFDYPLQFNAYRQEYMQTIEGTLSRGAYILGRDLEEFEANLARFAGAAYAVGVGNCTDALLGALHAAGVGPGDEVITVSHTFVATVEVIRFLGARPVFVDVADDHAMDVDQVERVITKKTRAIVPVSLNGRICTGIDRLAALAHAKGIAIIEDAAQSLGATYKGKGAGTFGLAGCFSFYPAKLLGAFGDAGAVVTDDAAFAERIRRFRNHGRGEGTEIMGWGLNCRFDNLQAAVLNIKLRRLPRWIERRREIAQQYHDALSDIEELRLPPPPEYGTGRYDVFQNYELEAEERDTLITFLKGRGVETLLPWGGKAVHQFEALGLQSVDLPRTEALFRKVLMLPLYPELEDGQVKYVAHSIKNFYARKELFAVPQGIGSITS